MTQCPYLSEPSLPFPLYSYTFGCVSHWPGNDQASHSLISALSVPFTARPLTHYLQNQWLIVPCGLKPLPLEEACTCTHTHLQLRHTFFGSAADVGLSHPVRLASLLPHVFPLFFPSGRQYILYDCSKTYFL